MSKLTQDVKQCMREHPAGVIEYLFTGNPESLRFVITAVLKRSERDVTSPDVLDEIGRLIDQERHAGRDALAERMTRTHIHAVVSGGNAPPWSPENLEKAAEWGYAMADAFLRVKQRTL